MSNPQGRRIARLAPWPAPRPKGRLVQLLLPGMAFAYHLQEDVSYSEGKEALHGDHETEVPATQ